MIKLISQFDSHQTKLSLATPTCFGGCCSCSCSCIGTSLVFGGTSVLLLEDIPKTKKGKTNSKKRKIANFLGWIPFFIIILSILLLAIENEGDILVNGIYLYLFSFLLCIILLKIFGKISIVSCIILFFVTIFSLIGEFFLWTIFINTLILPIG